MNNLCAKCGERMDEAWIFCARCGAHIDHTPQPPHEHEPAPVTGVFSGALLGVIAAPIMLIVGVMLCLTGWGIFLGIPVIVCAVLAPLAGPLFGLGAAKDKVL